MNECKMYVNVILVGGTLIKCSYMCVYELICTYVCNSMYVCQYSGYHILPVLYIINCLNIKKKYHKTNASFLTAL